MLLYKYRSLQNFKNLVDIFVNNRMYAAPYLELNDPMEGHYLYGSTGELDPNIERLIAGNKEKIRILSLSRSPEIALMWAHYADGNKGVAIGVKLDRGTDVREVRYTGPYVVQARGFNDDSAIEILTNKLRVWEYEQEERVFVRQGNFVSLSVREVILGSRMSNQDKSLVKKLVNLINPDIKVISQSESSEPVIPAVRRSNSRGAG